MEGRLLLKLIWTLSVMGSVMMDKTRGQVTLRQEYVGTNCPGTLVTYTCVTFGTDLLQWTVQLSRGQINTNTFDRSTNQPGATQVYQLIEGDNIVLTLTDASGFSMRSTLATTLSRELDQAEVRCSIIDGNFVTRDSDSAMINVAEIPSAPQNLMASTTIPSSSSIAVLLDWDDSFKFDYTSPTFPDRHDYIITTAPPTSVSSTPITSTTIELQYDVKYNVSVRAMNCVGESSAASVQLGPYSSELSSISIPLPSDHTEILTTPTTTQITPPDTTTNPPPSDPESPPPPFDRTTIIAVVVAVSVVMAVTCLSAASLIAVTIMAVHGKKRRRGCERHSTEEAVRQLERQRASGSQYSEVIHPVQNVAYRSQVSSCEGVPPQPGCHGCDEAGYEVIEHHDDEYCESVLTASSLGSYDEEEASVEVELHTNVSYITQLK